MKIYLLTSNLDDYDQYDACVVCAENEESAKKMHPEDGKDINSEYHENDFTWPKDINDIKCIEIGKSIINKKYIVLSSFY